MINKKAAEAAKTVWDNKWYLLGLIVMVLIYFYAYSAIGQPFEQKKFKYTIIICLCIFGCVFVVLFELKVKIEYLVLGVLLVFGTFSVFLTPVLDVPDEQVHFARAEATSRFDFFPYPNEEGYYYSIQSVNDLKGDVGSTYDSGKFDDEINYSYSPSDILAVANSFIGYIPQAIGIGMAKLMNLPAIWMMYFGRVGNLICSALLAFCAVKISGKAKPLIAVCSCFPQQVYLAASLSIDAFINYGALLFIAFVIKSAGESNQKLNVKTLLILILLCFCIESCKLTYAALSLLIFLIPGDRFEYRYPVIQKLLFVLAALISGVAFYFITLKQSSPLSYLTYLSTNNVNQSEQIRFILSNPLLIFTILIKEPISNISNAFMQFNGYGWFEYFTPFIGFTYLAFYGAFSLLYPLDFSESGKSRLWSLLTCLIVYFGTQIIMYLSWTPVGSTWIEGVQSRYFTPLLTLIPIILNLHSLEFKTKLDKHNTNKAIVFFVMFILISMNVSTLVQFY